VALRERGKALQVGEEHADLAFLAAELRGLRLGAEARRELRREVGAQQAFDFPDLAGGALGDRRLVGAEAEAAAQLLVAEALGCRCLHGGAVASIDPAQRLVQVEAGERLAARPLAQGRVGDEPERGRHEDVPLPPRRMPAAREGDGDHRFGEQDPGRGDAEQHGRRTPPVQRSVAVRREGVEQDAGDAERELRRLRFVRRQRLVEGRDRGQRDDAPGDEDGGKRPAGWAAVTEDCRRRLGVELEGRERGEDRRERETDLGRDHEARIRALEQYARCRQRVKPEEAGADEEGERDEEEAGVGASRRRLARQCAEGDADGGDHEDEPEMRRVVLPVGVEPGPREDEGEAAERDRDQERPDDHGGQEDTTSASKTGA
jgi:hypothetical protein